MYVTPLGPYIYTSAGDKDLGFVKSKLTKDNLLLLSYRIYKTLKKIIIKTDKVGYWCFKQVFVLVDFKILLREFEAACINEADIHCTV